MTMQVALVTVDCSQKGQTLKAAQLAACIQSNADKLLSTSTGTLLSACKIAGYTVLAIGGGIVLCISAAGFVTLVLNTIGVVSFSEAALAVASVARVLPWQPVIQTLLRSGAVVSLSALVSYSIVVPAGPAWSERCKLLLGTEKVPEEMLSNVEDEATAVQAGRVEALVEENRELRLENDRQAHRIADLTQRNTELEDDLRELATRNDTLEDTVEELTARNNALEDAVEELTTRNNALETRMGILETTAGEWRVAAEEWRTTAIELRRDNNELRTMVLTIMGRNEPRSE